MSNCWQRTMFNAYDQTKLTEKTMLDAKIQRNPVRDQQIDCPPLIIQKTNKRQVYQKWPHLYNNYKVNTVAIRKFINRNLVGLRVNDKKCVFILDSASDVSITKCNKCFSSKIASDIVSKLKGITDKQVYTQGSVLLKFTVMFDKIDIDADAIT